jgi:4,5-DOPA dioxygenase extradiol
MRKANNRKMPALFIGHGSPMNVVSKNGFTDSLAALGKRLPEPRAIMVISAHWLTPGTYVACNEKPKTIHDFYGFPEELYEIKYPCPGSPDDARFLTDSVRKVSIKCSNEWGLDHASWAILKHMYPKANIPVFEMSLDYYFNEWHPKPMQYHYDLASELGILREKGILIIGSGNIVHNLRLIDFRNTDAQPYDWAVEFDERVKQDLINKDHEELIRYQKINGSALAVPTLDHYLPMIYVLALQEDDDPLKFTYEGFQNGSISMRCFQIG